MAQGEDGPLVVIERDGGSSTGAFLLGAVVGAGLALLFAPRSGKETQERLKARAREFRDVAQERARAAQEGLEERLGRAGDQVREQIESVKGAVDAGRQAALDARAELQDRIETSKAAYRAASDAARQVVHDAGAQDNGEHDDDVGDELAPPLD